MDTSYIKYTIILFIFLCFIHNTVAWTRYGPEFTISHMLRELAFEQPVVPFLFGLLMGHLFWSR